MKNLLLIGLLLVCFNISALAAAFTSSQAGNWNSSSTWGGAGVPTSGDTVSIGHAVTVTASESIGTSPNDNTTAVLTCTGSGRVIVNSGVTLTVKGNIQLVSFGQTFTLNAGASLVFDASASGGAPVYKFLGVNVYPFAANGTTGNRCSISAVSGHTFSFAQAWSVFTLTHTDVTRMAASAINANFTDPVITNCTFTSCGELGISATGTTRVCTINDNAWTATTGSSGSVKVEYSGALSSGVRSFQRNKLDRLFTYVSKGFTVQHNYFGAAVACLNSAGVTWVSFRLNFIRHENQYASPPILTDNFQRNYFVVEGGGNPHFVDASVKQSKDTIVSQNVFEAYAPDLIDSGDVILVGNGSFASPSFKLVGNNNIVLASSYPGATVYSGALTTLYDARTNCVTEWYRNTGNVDASSVPGTLNAMFAVAEAGGSSAGQVAALKSNVAWANSSNQNYFAMRHLDNVKDIITPANADRNWTYNTRTGDNQRGYEDKIASSTMWTAGDAVAAGVDANQGSGNPQFFDSARNLASWAVARGYGADYAAGLAAIAANPTRTTDLINYIFEGYRPGNASMRNAAHDGATVGAANYYKSTRNLSPAKSHRASLIKFGL